MTTPLQMREAEVEVLRRENYRLAHQAVRSHADLDAARRDARRLWRMLDQLVSAARAGRDTAPVLNAAYQCLEHTKENARE